MTNVTTGVNPNDSLPEQAAQWHVLLHSKELSDADKKAFEQWLADKKNAEAYQRMQAVWGRFDELESSVAKKTLKQSLHNTNKWRSTRRSTVTLGSFVLLALVAAISWQNSPVASLSADYLLADYKTGVGEQQQLVLPDGSQLILNTASAVNIDYSTKQRTVYLVQGEVQLNVAKDINRPFIVMGEQGSARALGTQFSVRERVLGQKRATEVVVTESRVEVCVKGNPATQLHNNISTFACQTLQTGEQTRVHSLGVEVPQALNPAFSNDWVQHQLIVDNQPLLSVLDELARYHKGYLSVDRAALAGYRVSGVFPLDNIKRSLQVIAHSLPVQVKHYTPLLTRVGPR